MRETCAGCEHARYNDHWDAMFCGYTGDGCPHGMVESAAADNGARTPDLERTIRRLEQETIPDPDFEYAIMPTEVFSDTLKLLKARRGITVREAIEALLDHGWVERPVDYVECIHEPPLTQEEMEYRVMQRSCENE